MKYEKSMEILNQCKPEYKDILLLKLIRGETVDITKDSDMFYQINKDRVSLDEFTNRDKFKYAAKATKTMKEYLDDPRHAKTKSKKMRWLGDIPAEIWFSRPEFSPLLDKAERDRNIKKFLNTFTTFRGGEKQL